MLHPRTSLSILCLSALLGAGPITACDDDENKGKGAGATCASTCAKAVALACPNEQYSDEATCEAQCEEQIAGCDDPSIVQASLDCIETTPMTCGDTTGTATSEQCVEQGLALLACLLGQTSGGDSSTGGDTNTGGDPMNVEPPPIPTAGSNEIVVSARVGDTTENFKCDNGLNQTTAVAYTPAANGLPDALQILCFRIDDPHHGIFSALVRESAIVDGATIAIGNPVTGDILDTDVLRVKHVNAGEGFDFDTTANGSRVMQGTLHIEQKGGAGQPMRGYLTATWSITDAVHGGVTSQESEDLGPGAVSVAFDVVRH